MNKLRTLLLLLSVSALTSAVAEDLVLKPEQLTARYKAKVEQKWSNHDQQPHCGMGFRTAD